MLKTSYPRRTKLQKIAWAVPPLLSSLLFLLPYFAHIVPSIRTSGAIIYLYTIVFILIVISWMFLFYTMKKENLSVPVDTLIKAPLPVINRKMKVICIVLNLSGLVFILTGLIAGCYNKVIGEISVFIGFTGMASSYIFKYYAYKKDKYHHPRIVSWY